MANCPIYWLNPEDLVGETSAPACAPQSCTECCNCGYIQYESLIPYLGEIKDALKQGGDISVELEFKLREQILEISRVFDMDAGVAPGHFSKSHYASTKIIPNRGGRYLKVGKFVPNTLEVRNLQDQVLNPGSYAVQDGFLVYMPCAEHTYCMCSSGCGEKKVKAETYDWPQGCYKVTARWGTECADLAVQRAVREYLIESYRVQDPVVVAATGLPTSRTFRVPHSWASYISNFKKKNAFHYAYGLA